MNGEASTIKRDELLDAAVASTPHAAKCPIGSFRSQQVTQRILLHRQQLDGSIFLPQHHDSQFKQHMPVAAVYGGPLLLHAVVAAGGRRLLVLAEPAEPSRCRSAVQRTWRDRRTRLTRQADLHSSFGDRWPDSSRPMLPAAALTPLYSFIAAQDRT